MSKPLCMRNAEESEAEGEERREEREEEGKGMKVNSFLVCEHICFDLHHISLACTLVRE